MFARIDQARASAATDIQAARSNAVAQQQLGGATLTEGLPSPLGPVAPATAPAPPPHPTLPPAIPLAEGPVRTYPVNGAGVGVDVALGTPTTTAPGGALSSAAASNTPDMPVDQSQKPKEIVPSSRAYLNQS